jgi:hypothetical protein
MEQRAQIQASILLAEVRLQQVVERERKEILLLQDREAEFQQVVMAAVEAVQEVAAVAREDLEPMVVFLLEQVEQGLATRFLATMGEIRNHMVQVEMAEQI